MENYSPIGPLSRPPTANGHRFSKTIAVTYVGMGFFALIAFIYSLIALVLAVKTGTPLLFLSSAVLVGFGTGFACVIWALHRRRNWGRRAAVLFWLLCLVWSSYSIVHNGLHPEPTPGPLRYENEDQLRGARFGAFVIPYLMAAIEVSAV